MNAKLRTLPAKRLLLGFLLLSSSFIIHRSSFAFDFPPRLRWSVETTRPASYDFDLYRGETIALQPQFLRDRTAMSLPPAGSVEMLYRPYGVTTGTPWSVVGSMLTATSGLVTVPWTPAAEPNCTNISYTIVVSYLSNVTTRCTGKITFKGTVTGAGTNAPGAADLLSRSEWATNWLSLYDTLTNVQAQLTALDMGTASNVQANLDAHTNLTITAHGGIVPPSQLATQVLSTAQYPQADLIDGSRSRTGNVSFADQNLWNGGIYQGSRGIYGSGTNSLCLHSGTSYWNITDAFIDLYPANSWDAGLNGSVYVWAGTGGNMQFWTGGLLRWTIGSDGMLTPGATGTLNMNSISNLVSSNLASATVTLFTNDVVSLVAAGTNITVAAATNGNLRTYTVSWNRPTNEVIWYHGTLSGTNGVYFAAPDGTNRWITY